jgi:cyanophycinase-like exopeptidase
MAMGQWTLVRGRYPGDRRRGYRDALGLVPGIAVLPHFATFGSEWVTSVLKGRPSDDITLLGIDERTAVVWSGDVWQVMGDGEVAVITTTAQRVLRSGERADLPSPVPS